MTILHLGCGRVGHDLAHDEETQIITLDADDRLQPDIVCRLGRDPIPLIDDSIDRAIAVHVLEHIGRQGETAEWFRFWEELYRVLTPEGVLAFESPLYSSTWAWADPTHSRALGPESFVFFSQDAYRIPGSAISPYRIHCDFQQRTPFDLLTDSNPDVLRREPMSHFRGELVAIKPLKPWWMDPR